MRINIGKMICNYSPLAIEIAPGGLKPVVHLRGRAISCPRRRTSRLKALQRRLQSRRLSSYNLSIILTIHIYLGHGIAQVIIILYYEGMVALLQVNLKSLVSWSLIIPGVVDQVTIDKNTHTIIMPDSNFVTILDKINNQDWNEIGDKKKREAIRVYIAFALDISLAYNSLQSRLDPDRGMRNAFERHDFAFKWSIGEFDGANQLFK